MVISHLPPDVFFGTFTLPVSLLAKNVFSERSVPVTLPVLVFINISEASHPSSLTLPVLLVSESFSFTIMFERVISPVLPPDVRLYR